MISPHLDPWARGVTRRARIRAMLGRIGDAARWRLTRARKFAWQWLHESSGLGATPIFVVGAQRSGTNMFMETVDRSPQVWTYNEGSRVAFRDYRLRSAERTARLVRRSPARSVVFKPLCDSHLTDRLLEQQPGSKAVWLYRSYADVINSGLRMWGGNERAIRWITEGRWLDLGWRGERLSLEALDLVEQHYRAGLSPQEATALFWYLRTGFFFELGLYRDPRVLLVRYEDLVGEPERSFGRCFAFLGCELELEWLSDVVVSSVGKHDPPPLKPAIQALCEQRMRQFDSCYTGESWTR